LSRGPIGAFTDGAGLRTPSISAVARLTRGDGRPGPESEGGRVVVALVLGLGLLAGGAYTAAYLVAGDRVPLGTTVGGVDIGGKSPSSAMQALHEGLAGRADTPFTVTINGRTQQVAPSQAGLAVDYAASVRSAGTERSWRPSRVWSYYTAGRSSNPVVTLDQDRLATLLKRLDHSDGRRARDGSVVFRRQRFTVRPPRPGLVLDPRAAGSAFLDAYLAEDPAVALTMSQTAPTIGNAAIQRFVHRFANPAMASAVELHFGGVTLHLSPAAYGELLGARRVGHRLQPTVRRRPLSRIVHHQLIGAAIGRPKPATVTLVGDRPQVVSAQPGVTYGAHDIGVALLRAIASPHRTARVRATPAEASFTNADARQLGIGQQLSQFTVGLPGGRRGDVVASAVQRLDGTVLKPQRSLSLRHLLGAATPAGKAGDALATALFNAAWLGGMQVTAHASPRSYDATAPVGRDASLRGGHDLAFTDATPYGVLVSAVTQPRPPSHPALLTVTLWSTARWTITSSAGSRTDVVAAGRDVRSEKGCTPRDGRDGFQVTVTRTFRRPGAVDQTSSYTVSYAPVDAVVCQTRRRHGDHDH
jgi:VanW like protein